MLLRFNCEETYMEEVLTREFFSVFVKEKRLRGQRTKGRFVMGVLEMLLKGSEIDPKQLASEGLKDYLAKLAAIENRASGTTLQREHVPELLAALHSCAAIHLESSLSREDWQALTSGLSSLEDLANHPSVDIATEALRSLMVISSIGSRRRDLPHISMRKLRRCVENVVNPLNEEQAGVIAKICLLGITNKFFIAKELEIFSLLLQSDEVGHRFAAISTCIGIQRLPIRLAMKLLPIMNDPFPANRIAALEVFSGRKRYQLWSVPPAAILLDDEDRDVREVAEELLPTFGPFSSRVHHH